MSKKILVMKGDHIGPEVTDQGLKVLHVMAGKTGVALELEEALLGGASIDAHGTALTDEAYDKAEAADAILFGAAGGPEWDGKRFESANQRRGLLDLRKGLDLVHKQMIEVFTRPGLKPVEGAGKFDPNVHEAVDRGPAESEEDDQKILEVYQRGYHFKERLLRPAMVKVAVKD